jgi:YspA, cpYpsA-related SLOG family
MTHRILITGSRGWSDKETIKNAILGALPGFPNDGDAVVIHGGARGADRLAADICASYQIPVEVHEAEWTSHGVFNAAAGQQRNQRMVDAGADACLAFWDGHSRGTLDCINRAKEAGIPTMVYTELS